MFVDAVEYQHLENEGLTTACRPTDEQIFITSHNVGDALFLDGKQLWLWGTGAGLEEGLEMPEERGFGRPLRPAYTARSLHKICYIVNEE